MPDFNVIKRNGTVVPFDPSRIENAIKKAIIASHENMTYDQIDNNILIDLVYEVYEDCQNWIDPLPETTGIGVEKIQDFVERELIKAGFADTAKEYILYRQKRNEIRNSRDSISSAISELLGKDSSESDLKRDNGNVNGDGAMGTMLQIGSNVSKAYYLENDINKTAADNHRSGRIHIHDLDFYKLTVTCCQIDCLKLFKNGFDTGHGYIREPNPISTYAALAAIAIQSDQNDCHGGQSIPNFDYSMAPGVLKSFRRSLKENIDRIKTFGLEISETEKNELSAFYDDTYTDKDLDNILNQAVLHHGEEKNVTDKIVTMAYKEVNKQTYRAMEGFVHNLNSMHSRAGAQVPFSSINFGTDISTAGRMVIENLLLAIEAGLGHGETAIFPIAIFKVKEGVNYYPEDPNYDLFKLACKVSAKRLFPNFAFLDAPFNKQYYKEGVPESEVTYMGCRSRVMGNVHDPSREQSHSRGNLSFTSINLPMIALESEGDEKKFYQNLHKALDVVKAQLLERFEIQAKRKVYNFPFLMGQGIWLDSEKLKWDDEVREVLKHGSLAIGFVGLAEALVALYGHHHGEGEEYWKKGYNIIKYMREYTDKAAEETKLNFAVIGTPAESYAGRALRKTRDKFGVIEGVTDREYFTNSNHIPVYYPISAYDKIRLEAPFHELTNGGHITYVELDGDTTKNIDVFEKIIRCMHDAGIGYGSINHPVDRDPVCGYTGVINDECPNCKRKETEDSKFERIRRITGYLVGTLTRWNSAKKAEEEDRVKHEV